MKLNSVAATQLHVSWIVSLVLSYALTQNAMLPWSSRGVEVLYVTRKEIPEIIVLSVASAVFPMDVIVR